MKKGDKVEVFGARYHFFDDGEVVEFTGEYFMDIPRFKNSEGITQTVREGDFKAIPTIEAVAVFDDELDEMIAELEEEDLRQEHRPRDTANFTVVINEQALNDDIPFIIDAYYTANLSLREVGSLLGVDERTIRRRMKRHNIPTRTVSQALRAKYSM